MARRRHEHKVLKANERARRIAIENQLRAAGLPLYIRAAEGNRSHGRGGAGAYTPFKVAMKLNEGALNEHQMKVAEKHAQEMEGVVAEGADDHPLEIKEDEIEAEVLETEAEKVEKQVPTTGSITQDKDLAHNHPDAQEIDLQNLDAEARKGRALEMAKELQRELEINGQGDGQGQDDVYNAFRAQIAKEERKEFTTKLVVAWTLFFTFWMIGAAIFMKTENWSFGKSLYFCWVSFSTIGKLYCDDVIGDFSTNAD